MARPPKGKSLTMRTVRLDDDVWAECQRLGKEHGTINEGLAAALAALRKQDSFIHDGFGGTVPQEEVCRARRLVTQRYRAPLLKPSEKKK